MAFVIPVGFYRELKHGHAKGQSLREVVQPSAGPDDARAVKYLQAGEVMIATPGIAKDVLDPKAGVIGSPNVLTDGTYAWPGDLPYYVEKHHARLPADFVAHMAKNGWAVPANVATDDLELGEERDPARQAAYDKQAEDIAQGFLKAYMEYDDPEVAARREAEEARKEREDVAALQSFYIKTGQIESGLTREEAISRMLRYFAGRIEREAPDIGAVTIDQPLPDLAKLELGAAPDGKRYLIIQQTKGGGRKVSERLETGTKDQLVAWLRAPETVALVIAAMRKLAG